MKFGKTFASHQIPEWATNYMNYKHLKKTIRNFDNLINYQKDSPLDLPELIANNFSQFFHELDFDIGKVSLFYNATFAKYKTRLTRIIDALGFSNGVITLQVDTTDELDEIVSILLELRSIYRNLKWFGELNNKGFVKILKKLDKKLSYLSVVVNDQLSASHDDFGDTPEEQPQLLQLPSDNKDTYLSMRVPSLPFANGIELSRGLNTINEILNQLAQQQILLSKLLVNASDKHSLKLGKSRKYSFDKDSMQHFYEIILQNDGPRLARELGHIPKDLLLLKFLLALLNKATLDSSFNCIDALFDELRDHKVKLAKSEGGSVLYLEDPLDISGRNFFHQHVVSLGKKQVTKDPNQLVPGESTDLSRLYTNKSGPDGVQLTPIRIDGLKYVFDKISGRKDLQHLLLDRDIYQRTPLHYAAQYGTKDVTKLILEYLVEWDLVRDHISFDDVGVWGDQEGLTPLHLAIIGKHPKTFHTLINFSMCPLTCPNLLLLATRLGCHEIVKLSISNDIVDVDYTDVENNNETALYIASKSNLPPLVKFLLESGANPELGELVFGWTPIFAAAAEGLLPIIQELKEYGAHYHLTDDSGWLPMEHASLRGHLDAADALLPADPNLLLHNIDDPTKNTPREANPLSKSNLATTSPFMAPVSEEALLSTLSIDKLPELNRNAVNEVYRQFKQLDMSKLESEDREINSMSARNMSRSRSPVSRRKQKPIKSFGHKFLGKDENLVLITLGTTDTRDKLNVIDLNKISMPQSFSTELDTALSLVVTCHSRLTNSVVESPVTVDLPFEDQHGTATDPLVFTLANNLDISNVYVTFDIVPTYQYFAPETDNWSPSANKILGRGIALLDSVYSKVGPHLRSLNNTVTVPIMEQSTLQIMGKVRFEFMYVTPFVHSQMSISRSDTYWKQLVSTRVIGHRGLGKNFNNKKSLQLGENTVESFIAAASLGASYVEFDVQLTKDFVPVIYHDFLVAESGGDIPMHLLTSEQFFGLNEHEKESKQRFSYEKSNANITKNFSLDDEMLAKYNRPRTMSSYPSAPNMSSSVEEEELEKEFRDQMARRMKLTKTWKEKGFKGNARGTSIASSFVTLKELFKRLPNNVGFNMELKYPMLDEAQHESMGEFAFDLNFYVDTILKVVYDENTSGRNILFSSFHPDICTLLSLKQPTMPILYLTEAGTNVMADIRASSLQNAIRFAKKWNLLGIVSAAETLVKTPRLAQVVKLSGLVCVTYGVQNNDPEACKIQMKAGVDAVIADSVLAVREGLRMEEST